MVEIIPAILTNSPQELEEKIRLVEGLVSRVQIDVIDGVFAGNKTIDLAAVGNLETDLPLDVQLMVKEPIDWVEKSVRAMADRIIGHVEEMSDQEEFIKKVQSVGHSVGLALDLDTPVSKIDPLLLTNLDVVLVMSVKAGFGGQPFHPEVLEKVKELDEIRRKDSTPYKICIDGGINEDDIKMAADAGVDEFVVGHSLFDGGVMENLERLKSAI